MLWILLLIQALCGTLLIFSMDVEGDSFKKVTPTVTTALPNLRIIDHKNPTALLCYVIENDRDDMLPYIFDVMNASRATLKIDFSLCMVKAINGINALQIKWVDFMLQLCVYFSNIYPDEIGCLTSEDERTNLLPLSLADLRDTSIPVVPYPLCVLHDFDVYAISPQVSTDILLRVVLFLSFDALEKNICQILKKMRRFRFPYRLLRLFALLHPHRLSTNALRYLGHIPNAQSVLHKVPTVDDFPDMTVEKFAVLAMNSLVLQDDNFCRFLLFSYPQFVEQISTYLWLWCIVCQKPLYLKNFAIHIKEKNFTPGMLEQFLLVFPMLISHDDKRNLLTQGEVLSLFCEALQIFKVVEFQRCYFLQDILVTCALFGHHKFYNHVMTFMKSLDLLDDDESIACASSVSKKPFVDHAQIDLPVYREKDVEGNLERTRIDLLKFSCPLVSLPLLVERLYDFHAKDVGVNNCQLLKTLMLELCQDSPDLFEGYLAQCIRWFSFQRNYQLLTWMLELSFLDLKDSLNFRFRKFDFSHFSRQKCHSAPWNIYHRFLKHLGSKAST